MSDAEVLQGKEVGAIIHLARIELMLSSVPGKSKRTLGRSSYNIFDRIIPLILTSFASVNLNKMERKRIKYNSVSSLPFISLIRFAARVR